MSFQTGSFTPRPPGEVREPVTENGDAMNYIEDEIEKMERPHRLKRLGTWWERNGFLSQLEDKDEALRNFSPSLFLLSTCTCLFGILFLINPYFSVGWTRPLGWALWWFSLVQFIILAGVTIAKCYYHWNIVADLRRNKSFDLFFSAYILICFGIVMEGFIRYCPHYFGYGFVTVSVVLWWTAAVLAELICVFIPFVIAFYHTRAVHELTTVWLLGMFPGIVIALAGALIAAETNQSQARHIIYMTYLLIGSATPLVLMTLTLILGRFFFLGLPPPALIVSVLLPAAPTALLGIALVLLVKASVHAFPAAVVLSPYLDFASPGLLSTLTVVSLLLFGMSMWWLLFGVVCITTVAFKNRGISFSVAWWGTVFPLGLTGLHAVTLGSALHIDAFKIVGTALSLLTLLSGGYCAFKTTVLVWTGRLFKVAL